VSRFLTDDMNKDTDTLATECYVELTTQVPLCLGQKKKCTGVLFGVIIFLNAKNIVLLSRKISVLFVVAIPLL
jgi:hypothetical protein